MKHVHIPIAAIALLPACAQFGAEPEVRFLGDPAPDTAATKVIEIGPDTRSVNVTGGDIVKFVVDGKSFAWVFNVATQVSRFDLSRVAPPGMLNRPVFVYLAPDPRYIGGDGANRDSN